jgi:hypothetical protein
MESAISLFKQLPETKQQIKDYSRLIKESVLNGEVEPLQFAAIISALEQLFKGLKSDVLIKDVILEEAEKYGSKTIDKENVKFQIKEVGVKYDFTNCDDNEYDLLCDRIAELSAAKKERENFLKSITPEMEVYGSDGTQLKPAIKSSTTSVAVILK